MKLIEDPATAWAEEVIERSETAYFTHSSAFQAFCCRFLAKRAARSLGFQFDNGKRALLPLLQGSAMRGFFRTYESSYRGYGGLVADGALSLDERREAWDAALRWCLTSRFYRLTLNTSPLDAFGGDALPLEGLPRYVSARRENWHTSVVRLAAEHSEVAQRFRRDRRSDINWSRREGVQVEVARSESQFRSFSEIYQDRRVRWGTQAKTDYGMSFFQAARQVSQEDDRLKLWIASYQGKDHAGAIILYQGSTALYWMSASLDENRARPNSLLLATIIEDACRRGFKWFDMGRSGRPSLLSFKEGFGAEPVGYHSVTLVNHRAGKVLGLAGKVRQILHI